MAAILSATCYILTAIAMAAAQSMAPSNVSDHPLPPPDQQIQMVLGRAGWAMRIPLELISLAPRDPAIHLEGDFKLTNARTVQNVTAGDIAYISCDPSAHVGGTIGAERTLGIAVDNGVAAAVLYSNTSNFCNYTPGPAVRPDFNHIFSMTNSSDAVLILAQLQASSMGPMGPLRAQIERESQSNNGSGSGNAGNNQQQQQNGNPLGPSPSTAVAMIILYSITGVITGLFLIIIITGAVRAHRHPERYGPRDVLGRPRQSRAKGLARAMLDTIPIVKFGERLPPKPTDVELGEPGRATSGAPAAGTTATTEQSAASDNTDTAGEPRAADDTNEITPAADTAASQPDIVPDDSNTCSICTDDFELGQEMRVLPCNHTFHPACVDPWLLNVSGTCPLCRISLHPTTSNTSQPADSTEVSNPNPEATELPPPLEGPPRRVSIIRELRNLRNAPPNAPPVELVAALNRLREAERATGPAAEEAHRRRMRRLSSQMRGTFNIRTRRNGSVTVAVPEGQATGDEAGRSASATEGSGQPQQPQQPQQQQQQEDEGRRATIA